MWENCIAKYNDNIAINDNGIDFSFGQIEKEVTFFRTTLINNGIEYGDRIGIFALNSFEFVKAYLSVTTLGAVAVLLPPHLVEMSVFGISMKFNLKAIVFHETLNDKLTIIKAKRPNSPIINIYDNAPTKTTLVSVEKEDACTIIFTGGTTGKSKGAMLSNGAVLQGTKNGCFGYKDVFNQRYFLVMPLTHVFGLIRNLLTSLYTWSTLIIAFI